MAIEELKKLNYTGNSYFVVIPKKYIYAIGLKLHDMVIIRLTRDKIELIPYGGGDQCRKT